MFIAAFALLAAAAIAYLSPILVLEVTFGLLVLIISFLSTELAIYFLIFSMLLSPELVMAPLPQRNISVRMDDILIVIVSIGWLAKNAVHEELGLFVKTPLNKAILYYVIGCVAATLFGMAFGKVKPLQGTMFLIKYIEYFFIFFIAVNNIHSREQIKRYLIAILATAAIVSVYAIIQIPLGERVDVTFQGKSGEPNTLGGYLVLVASILIGIMVSYDSPVVRVSSFSLLAITSVPLLYTLSRSSWMALAAMYLVFLVFSRRVLLFVTVLLVVILFAGVIMPQKVRQRYRETFMERPTEGPQQVKIGGHYLDLSASERIISYRKILEDIKDHPVLGYGITGYGFIDGQFFRTLIETGLVGLATFIYLLYKAFIVTLQVYKNTQDDLFRGISLGMLAGLVALTAHALSANTFIIIRIMEPFWLLMALVVASENIPPVAAVIPGEGAYNFG